MGYKLPRLPARKSNTHKGDYGKVIIVAGSYGMAGAAYLATVACYRSGAGLVYLVPPEKIYDVLAKKLACSVIVPQKDTTKGTLNMKALKPILDLSKKSDVCAIGPGISQHEQTQRLVIKLVGKISIPTVIDADGLNCIATRPEILKRSHAKIILTPHEVELSRLLKINPDEIKKDRVNKAILAAKEFGCIVCLKGHRTIVTDGERVYTNKTGNPGMATGGTGDVLTGMIAALIGQRISLFDATCLGVYLHGLSGDLAAKKYGQVSLIATDLLEFIPQAFKHYARQ